MSYTVNFTLEAKKALAKIKDRIIYDIYEDYLVVLVLQLEGHYDDK